jgi:predicted TPR repeat methyltransferase
MSLYASLPPANPIPAPEFLLPSSQETEDFIHRLSEHSSDFVSLNARYGKRDAALRHLGLALWQRDDFELAISCFRAALALTPEAGALWRDLAGVLDASGDLPGAEACLLASLRHEPEHARSHLTLASLYSRMSRFEEAEAQYGRAVGIDAGLAEAHFGLGLLLFSQRRLGEAAASLETATASGYDPVIGHSALGHVRYVEGQFVVSAKSFSIADRNGTLDPASRRKFARSRLIETTIAGAGDPVAVYLETAGDDAEPIDDVLRDAFSLLSAYGHPEAAQVLGRRRLSQNPDDPVQRYLLDAVTGRDLRRAPEDYVEAYFDKFARSFDRQLVDVLHYDAPARLAAMLRAIGTAFGDVLDIGCGTGLAASHLRAVSKRLHGVDLSICMIEQAAKRGAYDSLEKAEALHFLEANSNGFDVIFAADFMVYFGDLADLFASAAASLRPGGYFAASFETADTSADYRLLPSGRFAHSENYIDAGAAPFFEALASENGQIRLEAGSPTFGTYRLFRRRAEFNRGPD